MSLTRALAFILSFLAVMSLARSSAAAKPESRTVTIDLVTNSVDERPTHVCIIHDEPSRDVLQTVGLLKQPIFEVTPGVAPARLPVPVPTGIGRAIEGVAARELLAARRPIGERAEHVASPSASPGVNVEHWTIRSDDPWPEGRILKRKEKEVDRLEAEVRNAFEAMRVENAAQSGVCGADSAACRPRFTVAANDSGRPQFLRCATNTVPTPGQARVAVLEVRFPANKGSRYVDMLSVVGNIVTVRFLKAGQTNDEALVIVRGGHYVEGAGNAATDDRVQVPLTIRCPEREIHLPGRFTSEKLQLLVTSRLDREMRCRLPVTDTIRVAAPDASVQRQRVKIALVPAGRRATTEAPEEIAAFEAEWKPRDAARSIEARPLHLRFRWKYGCAYPVEALKCPVVVLTETGRACEPTGPPNGGECEYRCPGEAASEPFSVPAAVSFSAADWAYWRDSIHYAGEVLSSYVEPEARRYAVDFSRWHGTKVKRTWTAEPVQARPGDRIESVELRLPNGSRSRVQPPAPGENDRVFVELPGGGCETRLRYQIVGDRRYDARDVTVKDGAIALEHPFEDARVGSAAFALGGGILVPSDSEPFAAPGNVATRPYLSLSLAGRLHYKRLYWFATELHGTFVLASQPYRPAHTPENSASAEVLDVAFNRFIIAVRPVFSWAIADRRIELSLNYLSLGLSRPLNASDKVYVGDWRAFWAPSASFRVYLAHTLFAEVTGRAFVGEPLYSFGSTGFRGNPTRTTHVITNFGADLTIGYDFF